MINIILPLSGLCIAWTQGHVSANKFALEGCGCM
uniref:Uncharacterized protein n=1 Tax=Anguilla anguilla TaxID=7936 RepID=A0A0E9T7U5_ANGAN